MLVLSQCSMMVAPNWAIGCGVPAVLSWISHYICENWAIGCGVPAVLSWISYYICENWAIGCGVPAVLSWISHYICENWAIGCGVPAVLSWISHYICENCGRRLDLRIAVCDCCMLYVTLVVWIDKALHSVKACSGKHVFVLQSVREGDDHLLFLLVSFPNMWGLPDSSPWKSN